MNGSTVNICALDLTNAFDKMNHHGLFIKLMKRNIPVQLLAIIDLVRVILECLVSVN